MNYSITAMRRGHRWCSRVRGNTNVCAVIAPTAFGAVARAKSILGVRVDWPPTPPRTAA